ncbi:MAG TPA: hypothetical protein VN258_16875 [Mobilitalea sp.]|nr:hypothetical protein [Mobilitalea sp.]
MSVWKKGIRRTVIMIAFLLVAFTAPPKASGEVQKVTDIEDKLEGISEEEKKVLADLFSIKQEIDGLELEETTISTKIRTLQSQTKDLEAQIENKQGEYDVQLEVLKQVMVSYQRGGPASYLEILLREDNLSEFLKSLNIMKDISHNVNELLTTLDKSKKELEAEKEQLSAKTVQIEQKKDELLKNLDAKQQLQQKQEDYLASLQEDRTHYQEQLDNITQMWTDCKSFFTDIVKELNRIIGSGYFTEADLNLDYGFFTVQGYLKEDTFNQVLSENSSITQTAFHFQGDQVVIEVPEKHLVLTGHFEIAGESAIKYVVEKGTFYDMPLEEASIEELFQNGPLLIDFKGITGDAVIVDFDINEVWSEDETLNFVIVPQF